MSFLAIFLYHHFENYFSFCLVNWSHFLFIIYIIEQLDTKLESQLIEFDCNMFTKIQELLILPKVTYYKNVKDVVFFFFNFQIVRQLIFWKSLTFILLNLRVMSNNYQSSTFLKLVKHIKYFKSYLTVSLFSYQPIV